MAQDPFKYLPPLHASIASKIAFELVECCKATLTAASCLTNLKVADNTLRFSM
jgi:hypothetical protein